MKLMNAQLKQKLVYFCGYLYHVTRETRRRIILENMLACFVNMTSADGSQTKSQDYWQSNRLHLGYQYSKHELSPSLFRTDCGCISRCVNEISRCLIKERAFFLTRSTCFLCGRVVRRPIGVLLYLLRGMIKRDSAFCLHVGACQEKRTSGRCYKARGSDNLQ